MARRESAHSVRQDCFLRESCSPFAQVMAKQRRCAARAELAMCEQQPNLPAKARAIPPGLLQANSLATRRQQRLRANSWTKPILLVQQPAKPLLGQKEPLLLQALGKDWRLLQPLLLRVRARARLCRRDPGPFAFFRETPAAQKCNRVARCGDYPTCARYHWQCSRRELVGYDNTHSRWLHKRARLARTFPTAVADKCLFLLRQSEDSDGRFATSV